MKGPDRNVRGGSRRTAGTWRLGDHAARDAGGAGGPCRVARTAGFGLRAAVLPAIGLALCGCSSGILDPKGPIGAAERTIFFNALFIMLAIVVPTIVATLGFAWWFRASNSRARRLPDFVYSGKVEIVVWSIPTLVIIFLGGITWIGSHDLDPRQNPSPTVQPLEVQVVSLDWKWLFIYPEQGVAAVNQLVIPVGRPVHFSLTSASVMNAFFIPQLGSMIYAMNGMTSQLYLQADHEGDFRGLSTHFSGDGFSGMTFVARAVPASGFDGWVEEAKRAEQPLDHATYLELAKQSINVPAGLYGSVQPGLFDAVVTQQLPPSAGPQVGAPTADVSSRSGDSHVR